MICRLCLNTLDEQNAVLLFAGGEKEVNENKTIPENYLVQLISTHLYLCLSRDDAISTSICTDCCVQLESFHNFWKLVEHKQTTLCSQFLEIDCDVNWSEEGDVEQSANIEFKQETEPELETDDTPNVYDSIFQEETEFHEPYLKVDLKTAAVNKFPCMFCDKSFKMRRYLEEHVATHTGDRPIACAYCNTAFRCRSNMYTHVKTKHNSQWQKARADRESAKVNSNNNVQIQRAVNGDSDKFAIDAITVPQNEPQSIQSLVAAPTQPHLIATKPPSSTIPAPAAPALAPAPPPTPALPPLSIVKSEPMEAINLTVAKVCPMPPKRVTRASRRKTHSPKKVQHTERSNSASEDSSNDDDIPDLHKKRLKTELQTSKENELILANYNAVAAVVAAATANHQQQQRICATILQQHQEQLLTAMAAVSTSACTSTSTNATTAAAAVAAAAGVALSSQTSEPTATPVPILALPNAEPYTCSICGQQLRNQRALNNHLHNKHNALPATTAAAAAATPQTLDTLALPVCPNCGELSGQSHQCNSKAKYACDICGKSFKMKRYLEEHFATHTGVKLHTCAFCPTEFRSKSNMYHHTKRKHKLEWEQSRASRNAAKTAVIGEPQQQEETSKTNSS